MRIVLSNREKHDLTRRCTKAGFVNLLSLRWKQRVNSGKEV